MAHHSATCAAILSSVLFASSAFAGSEINKCVSPSGAVTLTDEACPPSTRIVKLIRATPEAESGDTTAALGEPRRPVVERFNIAPMPLRFAAPMRGPAPARGMALDIATLKAAKANLTLVEMASTRGQRLAGLP